MVIDIKQMFESVIETPRNDGRVIYKIKKINANPRGIARLFLLRNSPKASKEKLLKELDLKNKRIKNRWIKVEKEDALKILNYILSRDMAYDFELDTKPMANQLSSYFIDQFGSEAQFYTNGEFHEELGFYRLGSWISITNSIFDTGVLVVDQSKIGIFWAEDND
jgi:hypothetical protein